MRCRLRWRSFRRRSRDHKLKALLSGRQFRDVMFGMSSTYMLLHRSISLFLSGERDNVTTNVLRKATGIAPSIEESCKCKNRANDSRVGHSRRDNASDSLNHPDFATDRRPHYWHRIPKMRRSRCSSFEVALFPMATPLTIVIKQQR